MVTRRRASTPPALALSVAVNDFRRDLASRCRAFELSVTVIVVADPAPRLRRAVPTVRDPRRPSLRAVFASTVSSRSACTPPGTSRSASPRGARTCPARAAPSGVGVTVGVGVGSGRGRRRLHRREHGRGRRGRGRRRGRDRRAPAWPSASVACRRRRRRGRRRRGDRGAVDGELGEVAERAAEVAREPEADAADAGPAPSASGISLSVYSIGEQHVPARRDGERAGRAGRRRDLVAPGRRVLARPRTSPSG